MALHSRHSGFQNISWCGVTIDLCTVADWSARLGNSWDLGSDDDVARTGILASGAAGEITITGRRLGALGLTMLGRSGDMVITLLDADSELGITGDVLTLHDTQLLGVDNRIPTDNIGEKSLRFSFSKAEGDTELYTVS